MDQLLPEMFCPICYEMLTNSHNTKCGHTFCHQCIVKSIERNNKCPLCSKEVNLEHLNKNMLLDELITKFKTKNVLANKNNSVSSSLNKCLSELKNLDFTESNILLDQLVKHKECIGIQNKTVQNFLLFEFLKKLLKQKEEEKMKIMLEINIIKNDFETIQKTLIGDDGDQECTKYSNLYETGSFLDVSATTKISLSKLDTHFEDFVSSYFTSKVRFQSQIIESDRTPKKLKRSGFELNNFKDILSKCCKYSSLKCKSTINSSSNDYAVSNIVSSIVLDKDSSHFAIGGVTKRIKIYDFILAEQSKTSLYYPLVQLVLPNKISCLSWNNFHQNFLASSDYEGIVNIWDVETGARTKSFNEHEKRCWSIDFNEIDANLLVSGSDDNKVKIWSLKENQSIATLEAESNVCSVKFNPKSSFHFAYGSADHNIYYMDLRYMNKNLYEFKGHKKSVSYVNFLNSTEFVSASTDSHLKYWNINSPGNCLRSFLGHVNEKHFVGLATESDFIACGSEDNSIYLYYKELPSKLLNYKMNVPDDHCNIERRIENDFVSAVCWKNNSRTILAANSRGLINILELI